MDGQIRSCQCECVCTVHTHTYKHTPACTHTHRELFPEYSHDKEEQDSPQSIMERLFYDPAGCSMKAFDVQMYLGFLVCEKHTSE